jgi:DNA-binding transcriptional regulator YiaG
VNKIVMAKQQYQEAAMDITEEIKEVRKKVTRRRIAAELGVTEGTVYNWENGKGEPGASQMEKIRGLKKDG